MHKRLRKDFVEQLNLSGGVWVGAKWGGFIEFFQVEGEGVVYT